MAQWIRFETDGTERFGTLTAGTIQIHTGDLFAGPTPTGETLPLDQVRLLAPVRPGKFIGLWNNFHALAAKTGAAIPAGPLYFLKAPGSVLPPGDTIRKPGGYDGKVLYEGELGIVIGRRCTRVDEARAEAAIFGYTCVNDVTPRSTSSPPTRPSRNGRAPKAATRSAPAARRSPPGSTGRSSASAPS
ncbi:MAG: fumarylacetoacetate hydrolase family protein [Acetobacteraceae bacterium]